MLNTNKYKKILQNTNKTHPEKPRKHKENRTKRKKLFGVRIVKADTE